jgi:hypothetical protein
MPMPPTPDVGTDDQASNDESTVTNANGEAGSPTPDDDREVESWLDELGPPAETAPDCAPSTNGDDPDETTAVPTRLQQDPDIS